MTRMFRAVVGLAVLACLVPPVRAAGPDGICVLTLSEALPGGKDLNVMLNLDAGRATTGFATAPRFNRAVHAVDASGLRFGDGVIAGVLKVVVVPDLWVPQDGKPIECSFALEARIDEGAVSGRYSGARGGDETHGELTGRLGPAPAPDIYTRIDAYLPQVMISPSAHRGGKWKRDAKLGLALRDGRAIAAQFDHPAPDYTSWSGRVDAMDFRFDGKRLTGEMKVRFRYQSPKQTDGVEEETGTVRLDALVIGDSVAGTFDVILSDRRFEGNPFMGSVERPGEIDPTGCLLRVTLHDGMQGRRPINLLLSLADPAHAHGYAYGPMHNHQPQVAGGSLQIEDGRLTGPVSVHFRKDCYWEHEPFRTLHMLDLELRGMDVVGTFTGTDRDTEVAGAVSGELVPKAPPVTDAAGLAAIELALGYSVRGRDAKSSHATVTLRFQSGRIVSGEVVCPTEPDAWTAEWIPSHVGLMGDRVEGTVLFRIAEGDAAGKYRFDVDAFVDGDRIEGYWLGWRDDEPIWTKSAKLRGRLIPVGGAQESEE